MGAMEVSSWTEMGVPGASHLGTGDHGPKTDRSRPPSVPVNALVLTRVAKFVLVGCTESPAYSRWISSTLKGSTKQFGWLQARDLDCRRSRADLEGCLY
jgi:hypothetical protein